MSSLPPGGAGTGRDLVVLVHGMGRSRLSMMPLAWALRRAGFDVLNWGYSSVRYTIAQLGQDLAEQLSEPRAGVRRVHFIGHSLGTVIIRHVIAHGGLGGRVGRVVMLAPPNQGSAMADRSARWWGWLFKPLSELRTEQTSTARTLIVPPHVEVGVIAGRFDAKVTVAETHFRGETAHVVVPAFHTFLMLRPDVTRLAIAFLRTGTFGK